MLSLEMIAVLGALFGFVVFGMVGMQLGRRRAEVKRRREESAPASTQKARRLSLVGQALDRARRRAR